MSISIVLNRWLNRTYKSIAMLLVIFAVTISALRLLLPYAHNYRQDVQDYLNSTYNSHIIIGAISMEWQKQGPSLIAQRVSLLQTDAAEVFIEKMDLQVDFWRSIRSFQLVTKDITLVGAKVLFDKTMLTESVNSKNDSELIDNISELFLDQIARFSLKNSQVIYRTKQKDHTFLIDQLRWLNEGERHRANGSVIVDGLTSNNLKLQLDVKADELANMTGQLYLEANQLNITPWLGKVLAIENDKTDSEINFNAWLSIDKGIVQNLQLSLGDNAISFLHNNEKQTVNIAAGGISANNLSTDNGLSLVSTPIIITTNGHVWSPLTVEAKQTKEKHFIYLSSLDLTGLAGLIPLFSADEKARELIAELSPQGIIENVYWQEQKGVMQVSAAFSEASIQFSQGIPSLQNLSGDVIFSDKQLQVNLLATNGALDFDKHFMLPIPYNELSATINASQNNDGWQYNINDIEFVSEELKASAELAINAPNEGATSMALLASISDGDAKFAEHYYPHLLMGDDLVDYLNSAIVSGKLNQAQVLFNGPLANFPFEDNSGIFVVDAELTDSVFSFDEQWPAIKNFNANLNFTNNSMLITGRSGHLTGIDVTGVEAAIASLNNKQTLTVDATFTQTAANDIAELMNNSPMADSVGAVLEQLVVSKPISGEFSLNLPLNDIDAVVASGLVNFVNNDINLQTPEMNFSEVNGQLSFINDVLTTKNLSVNWRNLPLSLSVNAKNKQDYYGTNIKIDANWQDKNWLKQVPVPLKKYASGTLPWQGQLSLHMNHDQNFSYSLIIGSTLDFTELNLPAPYQLAETDTQALSIKVTGEKDQSIIHANFGEELSFYGALEHKNEQVQITRSHLLLGNEDMLLPMDGFHITTKLAHADFEQWQPFVFDIIESIDLLSNEDLGEGKAEHLPLIGKPERIRGSISSLDLFGQTLTDVLFDLHDTQSWWLLDVSAKEARSQIKFYPDWQEQGLDIDADFIHLIAKESNDETLESEPFDNQTMFTNFPVMRVQCDSCRYGKIDLGAVSFSVDREKQDLLRVNNFQAKRGGTQINFDAQWQHNEMASQSKIEGSLKVADVEQEFERLGYPSTVRDSNAEGSYNLNWQGGLHNFNFVNLNGKASMELGDGYLAEIPDTARAFSLLSLQSLVRKLTFDFSDLFSKGMPYSDINGDFDIKDGILYTKNTKMTGHAGDLSIKGNTDLVNGLLDLRMSYKPNLTSSIPTLAWIATLNPVVFLAGIALDEVIISKVVSEFNYEITGSIDDPQTVEVNRKNMNIRVGADSPPQIVETLPESNEYKSKKSIGTKPIEFLPNKNTNQLAPIDNFDG